MDKRPEPRAGTKYDTPKIKWNTRATQCVWAKCWAHTLAVFNTVRLQVSDPADRTD